MPTTLSSGKITTAKLVSTMTDELPQVDELGLSTSTGSDQGPYGEALCTI